MRKVIDAGDDTLPPCRSFSQSHSHPFVPLIVFSPSYYLVYFSSCFFMMHHLAHLVIILPSLPTLLPFISLFLYSNSGPVLFCCVQYRAFLWLRFALATSLHKRCFVVVVFKSQMKVMFDLMLYDAWEGKPGYTLTDQYGLFCSNVSDSFIIS